MWGSCSTVVIYSGGLRPYLFSISLMLGSGFPPALPWPTGRRVWVGPLQKLPGTSTTNTRSPFRSFNPHSSALTLLLFSPLQLHVHSFTIPNPTSSRTNTLRHSYLFTLSLSISLSLSPLHSLFSVTVTLSLAISWHRLEALNHMQTCKHPHRHAHTHSGRQSHTLTWIAFTAFSQPPYHHHRYSVSTADVMLANTFHFLR